MPFNTATQSPLDKPGNLMGRPKLCDPVPLARGRHGLTAKLMAEIPEVEFVLPRGDACVIRVARETDAAALVEYLNRIGGETPFLHT